MYVLHWIEKKLLGRSLAISGVRRIVSGLQRYTDTVSGFWLDIYAIFGVFKDGYAGGDTTNKRLSINVVFAGPFSGGYAGGFVLAFNIIG